MRKAVWIGIVALIIASFCGCSALDHTYPTIEKGRKLTFPRDHFAHKDFRTEWWYYNGRLEAEDGSRYGFELVFFKRRTDEDKIWGYPIYKYTNPAHLAHFSITDLQEKKLHYADKRTRDFDHKRGPAGALEDSYMVWNESWSAKGIGDKHFLKADMKGYDLSIAVEPAKKQPFVLHGDNGYFLKSGGPDFARGTFYIAFTRLVGEGYLFVDGKPKKVKVSAWMDHEFGSHQLAPDQLGWDWFSIQFADNTEVMLYLLKQADGSWSPLSKGTYVDADGKSYPIRFNEIRTTPLRTWKGKGQYTIEWKFEVLPLDLEMIVRPLVDDQEIDSRKSTMVVYWEGIVEANGTKGGKPIHGEGYMELCGNAHPVHFLTENRSSDNSDVN